MGKSKYTIQSKKLNPKMRDSGKNQGLGWHGVLASRQNDNNKFEYYKDLFF